MDAPPFKQVRVMGKRHRVKWVEKVDDGHSAGEFVPRTSVINIALGQSHDDERETVLHELLHAVMYQVGCEVPEVKHRPFSCAMYALLKDNPRLVEYLLQEEPDDES